MFFQANGRKLSSTVRNREQEELLKKVKRRLIHNSKLVENTATTDISSGPRVQELPISYEAESTFCAKSPINFSPTHENLKNEGPTIAKITIEKLKNELQRANLIIKEKENIIRNLTKKDNENKMTISFLQDTLKKLTQDVGVVRGEAQEYSLNSIISHLYFTSNHLTSLILIYHPHQFI